MSSTSKILSIIIVTFNSDRDIFDCIDSILKQNTLGDALEIIVVDNHSTSFEQTSEKLYTKYPGIVIIENKNNGGYGQGNNMGIALAKAPLIAIVNPDVRWDKPIINEAIKEFNDPNTVLLGCRQMENENRAASAIHYKQDASGFEKSIGEMIANRLGIYCAKRMYLSGACFFCRKKVMEEIGGFDENIFLYAEENDIRYRILALNKGYCIRYRHDLQYIHPCHNRLLSMQTEKQRIEADLYVLNKQGVPTAKYYNTERAKCRWNIFLHCLTVNKEGIARQKKLLSLYETKS